jgi:chromosomal replication initiator protein
MMSVELVRENQECETQAIQWGRVRARLRSELGEDVFTSWFRSMELETLEHGHITLSVPTRFLKSWIQSHYAERLNRLWLEELPKLTRIDINVRNGSARPITAPLTQARPKLDLPLIEAPALQEPKIQDTKLPDVALQSSPLDPKLTFESFIQGRTNTLARAASMQVGQSRVGDAVLYNPLYIHAAVGLGKSHLLQAIAHSTAKNNRKALYLTAEKFMYGFVTSLKNQTAMAFKETLRGIDVLIIDDLQFLQGKMTQVEFCHTLNALIDSGRQVVVAADRPANELESLDERVRSRLAGGLTVEIGALDENLRLEILKQKLTHAQNTYQGFDIPPAVLSFVAHNVTQNGRDLEGAFNRLLAHSRLTGQVLNVEIAEKSIRDLIKIAEPKRVKIEDIQRIVAKHYNVSRQDILSSRRTASVVKPRQIAMYLSKTLTLRSLPEIGRRFGGRDHTTVLHAVRKIEGIVQGEPHFNDELESLRRMINE